YLGLRWVLGLCLDHGALERVDHRGPDLLRHLGVPALSPVPGRAGTGRAGDRCAELRVAARATDDPPLLAGPHRAGVVVQPARGLPPRLVALLLLPAGLQPPYAVRRDPAGVDAVRGGDFLPVAAGVRDRHGPAGGVGGLVGTART